MIKKLLKIIPMLSLTGTIVLSILYTVSYTHLDVYKRQVYFLPYVTNTLAIGLVFMILFKKTAYTDGLINLVLNWFGGESVYFIDGPYWAKMLVLCVYTVWVVMPFKILILTSALASVNQTYYNAARVDGTSTVSYTHLSSGPSGAPLRTAQ